jgi:hypothetical protein
MYLPNITILGLVTTLLGPATTILGIVLALLPRNPLHATKNLQILSQRRSAPTIHAQKALIRIDHCSRLAKPNGVALKL